MEGPNAGLQLTEPGDLKEGAVLQGKHIHIMLSGLTEFDKTISLYVPGHEQTRSKFLLLHVESNISIPCRFGPITATSLGRRQGRCSLVLHF